MYDDIPTNPLVSAELGYRRERLQRIAVPRRTRRPLLGRRAGRRPAAGSVAR